MDRTIHRPGTPGNIQRLKKSLEAKEIIDFFSESPEFTDPFFELWCRKMF